MTPYEVHPDVFWLPPPDAGAVFVVRTGEGLVMFDSSFLHHRDCLLDQMREAGIDPRDIRLGFITHVHCDHVGGMGWWSREFGFPVVAQELAAGPVETADELITASRMDYARFEAEFVPCPVAHCVAEEATFTVGGRAFEAVSAPGHTTGSLHVRMDGCLFVGDTLFADGTVGWLDVHWGSQPADYVETLQRMRAHVGVLVLPGHGEPFILSDEQIDHAIGIVSFYLGKGHGYGNPIPPSLYKERAGETDGPPAETVA